MRNVIILGLTGSIGNTALRGIERFRDSINIVGASCHNNIKKALDLCCQYSIPNLCVTSNTYFNDYPSNVKIWGNLKEMLDSLKADIVLNGISGSPGLRASFDVLSAHSDLALANKESVVMGGHLLFDYSKKYNQLIIPVDSEHSAIDELIRAHGRENTKKLIITASGGPFKDIPLEKLDNITVDVAIKHPTWKMGPKISIDSSTLANKGLEVIEAHYLFNMDSNDIEVVIHPQSIIHSMIRTTSGQVYSQMSPPDMVFPIMRALCWPNLKRQVGQSLDFTNLDLTFRKPDINRFPFLSDAFETIRLGGSYPIVYNTANEIAVYAFMDGKIPFTSIQKEVRKVLDRPWTYVPNSIEEIEEVQKNVQRVMEF
ncbi:MAG: 1-deoxy-D-xylulose-5-phosphate reductoisomerase [Sphaerochaetaceae bacterium]|nr:1-deoxy-D-xylulose-5-phosphate reductoisomerase [Sphaerochaetaceae bacterium]